MAIRRSLKLAAHFYDPYPILEHIGQVAYELGLLVSSKIHPVFYELELKRYVGTQVTPITELP